MKLWLKRYLILFLCLCLAFLPLLSILASFDVLQSATGKIIFWSITGSVFIIFFGVMTFLMFKDKSKLKQSEKRKNK